MLGFFSFYVFLFNLFINGSSSIVYTLFGTNAMYNPVVLCHRTVPKKPWNQGNELNHFASSNFYCNFNYTNVFYFE